MTPRGVVAFVLLIGGVAIGIIAAVGLLLPRSAFDRLHLLAPVSSVGIVLVVASIVTERGLDATGAKSILAGVLILVLSPIITHMTARARWHGGHHGSQLRPPPRDRADRDRLSEGSSE